MDGKKIVGIILIGIAVLLVLGVVVAGGIGGAVLSGQTSDKQKYECTVQIKDKVFTNPIDPLAKLSDVDCKSTGNSCFLPFTIFSAEGVVEIWDDEKKLGSARYDTDDSILTAGILIPGSDTVTITVCSDGEGLVARLKDDDGNVIDQKNA